MSETSSFGTSKREGHDSSAFYARKLYHIFDQPIDAPVPDAKIPDFSLWADQIYCKSATSMDEIPSNSVGLAFTSPPYNVGKDYDDDMSFNQYLALIKDVAQETYRVLRPGGRYVVNIANLGRKPYIR